MNLTYPTTLVLHTLASGVRHGFDVIDATGLPGGTVYPILRRLAREALVSAQWEDAAIAHQEQRPPRRYYELTAAGTAVLAVAVARYPVPRAIAARARRLRPAPSLLFKSSS
jgi:PadR family transcriptional regulator, regulatory protein PadR